MFQIVEHKRFWRMGITVFLMLTIAGPWTFDKIHVPSEYPCSNSIRLGQDFCGIPFPGTRVFYWGVIGFAGSVVRLVTGGSTFAQGIRDLAVTLLLLLLFLPVISMLWLGLKGGGRRWWWFHIGALCLAVALGLLFATSGFSYLHWASWGIWLYVGLMVSTLVLEFATLSKEGALTHKAV